MIYINQLANHVDTSVTLKGWVYNIRTSKALAFIELRDGTGLAQCVVAIDDVSDAVWEAANSLKQESSLEITGMVKEDERSIGGYEIHVTDVTIIQIAEDYPITPKDHGIEFLMNNRHLWLRSQRQWAAMRVRNEIIFAIHSFFHSRNFVQMDSPIFTSNAAEGSTTLFETDYFDEKAYLAQTGQLYGEAMAMAHGLIYTFGPTFRAEKSKTRRHLTEFWMIEPEMAFYDLDMNMAVAEELLLRVVHDVLRDCREELAVLGRDVAVLERIRAPFPRISYSDAVDLLRSDETQRLLDAEEAALREEQAALEAERAGNRAAYGQAKRHEQRRIDAREIAINARLDEIEEALRNIPGWKASAAAFEWGNDFGGSDETVLTKHFDQPIIVHRFPAAV